MKRLIVASANPVKSRATERAFGRLFPGESFRVEARAVDTGGPAQPQSDEQTLAGARARARAAAASEPEADVWIGIEGGVEDRGGEMMAFAWVVTMSSDGGGHGRSASFMLPPAVRRLVLSGLELGDADDRIFGTAGSKRRGGAVGLLTGGALDRSELYEQAVMLALIPLRDPSLYRIL